MVKLKGRNAIVTGAAVGLGCSYAKALAREGVNVAVCDLREEIHEVAEILRSLGVNAASYQGDVSDPAHVRAVVDGAQEEFGNIDILVNNAGVWGASVADDDLDKSIEDYEQIVGTNLKGEYLFGRAVIPIMIEQGKGGEIVNIATDHMVTCGTPYFCCPKLESCPWGDSPRPTGGGDAMDLYDAGKWGLNGLLYGWAKALAPHNIRVNAFCMGATDSHMLRGFHNFEPSDEEVASWMRAEDNAQAMIDMLQEGPSGRNAQNVNFCMGRPVQLEPAHDHVYVVPEQVRIGESS
ncbi:MAG: SDR family oxidoreductase [Gammaproteobacteria bacterium]|jgi:NAD(P)-dependent dehydrogenase (short-subunit alcohol dehydrogenase family)|nr:SDR family oxidoreductase [Gammaproteobacteria bacterium]MBT3866837.1 SDR family oxidoreductase [Gammaproteobacteria bacterium]MBT5723976.1 SDR family oxidoreductase [Gammaproteobacteria bacterium]MBT6892196.1 SDR family oxidoreductase [Gammaproteobacteria bacterium]